MLAEYITKNEARPYKPAPEIIRKILDLDKCLEAMKATRSQVKNRFADTDHLPKEVITAWKNVVKSLNKQIKKIELDLQELINSDSTLKQDYENL